MNCIQNQVVKMALYGLFTSCYKWKLSLHMNTILDRILISCDSVTIKVLAAQRSHMALIMQHIWPLWTKTAWWNTIQDNAKKTGMLNSYFMVCHLSIRISPADCSPYSLSIWPDSSCMYAITKKLWPLYGSSTCMNHLPVTL